MEKQNGEQKHNRCALKQRRDASKDVLFENVEQDALEREESSGCEHSARADSRGVR
jgi:hypothetical protein